MSRSYKKTPVSSNTTARSEKLDKKTWHSRRRAVERTQLASAGDLDTVMPVLDIEVSNVWDFAKDGKHYLLPSTLERLEKRRGHRKVLDLLGK